MKIQFRKVKLSAANKVRLDQINDIIERYQRQGYVLTLRQLYYQLVTKNIIPNQQKEYAKLSILLKEGRMGGVVDWSAIEDRVRQPDKPSTFDSPADIIDACINQYAVDRRDSQTTYLEVWVEKDALSGVLKRVTRPVQVPIMVNRGYSSASAMYDAYERFTEAWDHGQSVVILYLGDHDPSGTDMIRDIRDRIMEFANGGGYEDALFDVEPIALTMPQIRQYTPPPNPAKIQDPRAADYIARYGNKSWEVDALTPEVLHQLVQDAIDRHTDQEAYDEKMQEEDGDKEKLKSLKEYL